MTLDLSWPTTLPLPLMQGYGIEDDPKIVRTDMEAGSSRQRRTSTQASSELTVQWNFTLFQFALFESWLRHRANYGATWFNITYLAGPGLLECEARFQKGKAPAKFQNGARVVVTAKLDVRDRPMLEDGDLDVLLEVTPEALDAGLIATHLPIVTGLPGTPYFWDWR